MAPPFLTSATISVRHGFFGRAGGVSAGLYEGLNCGPGSADAAANVSENRRRCCDALSADALVTGYQIHSADAAFIETTGQPQPKADALVTRTPGLALGILTADCIPVLFHDPRAGVIGAAHAGWRGALGGVLEACIGMMQQHGATPENIHAAIGPCLRPPHFQVGDDLVSAFIGKYPVSIRFFTPEASDGKYQCDLTGFAMWRLGELGLGEENISDTGQNTLADPAKYFSYRHSRQASHKDYGRNLSAIVL
ncbi:peptidoglycan editing factor PgeF [Aquisalinus flavus]|uniref:Purine nucleoside phosphorylase n=1 Tax=Aquisalinus flavus TaxID=1526572 RepID=A0A8J2Y7P1_9PROT|nr:peptidoglycan editing factor PgeF [Aquisalinus flavus]MBD0427845.1 peptidoglycan editing factor PgeF [Aquisalinus flavus]UNE47611.1 peptidoglycan editing factor PgeF [Aquisalinus flavus]GGD04306.1 laccase domain protein [Aquisalinus flavus]